MLFLSFRSTYICANENLLKNPGFEDQTLFWISYPSSAIFQATQSAKVGSQSALLTKNSSSYAYFYQRVPIENNTYYQLSGYTVLNDSKINNIKLRVNYLDEKEAKIANFEIGTTIMSPDWQYLETIPVLSPENAFFAEIQGYAYLNEKNPGQPALFDELNFVPIAPTIIPSPTLTSTPTLTPTPTPSVTVLPTITLIPTPQPEITLTLTPNPTPTITTSENIFLSEIMVNPETGDKEWIEIYNNNDFNVSLDNWYIDDQENSGSSPKPLTLTIKSHGYGVFEISSAIFNNDTDTVRLLDNNKKELDSFEYSDSEKNLSYGRTGFETSDFCLQQSSKGTQNNSCIDNESSVSHQLNPIRQ